MNRMAMVNEGDLATVDMNVIRHENARRGMGLGHWLKVVRDTVRMGDGKVRVERIRGVDADVVADGGGAIMGPVTVPLGALRKAASKTAESEVVFHASSRGGRWELVGYADGKYEDLKHGKVTGSGGTFSRVGLAHKLAAMIQDSKVMDGINYIIDIDRLGVKQLLSKIDPSKPAPAEFYRMGTNMNKIAVAKELVAIANEFIADSRYGATGTRLSLVRKPATDEWVVKVYINGKYDDDKSYYTDDKQDAISTMSRMKREMGVTARELVVIARELQAIEFPTQDAYDKYMKEHPDADKSLHSVKKTQKNKKVKEPETVSRISVPKSVKPADVPELEHKKIEDKNYEKTMEFLKGGKEKRVREILQEAKKRPDEIDTTRRQWESFETMPKHIVEGWEEELGRLPHQVRGIERALDEWKSK